MLVVLQRCFSEDYLPAFLAVYAPQPLLLLPLAGTLLLCLFLWQWRLLRTNFMLLVIAIVLLVPPVIPHSKPPDAPQRRIRIVTWNTHEQFESTDKIAAILARLQPDIVCLQETRRGAFNSVLPGAKVAHTHEVTTLTCGRILRQEPIMLGETPNFRWGMDTDILLPQGRLRVFNVHYVIDVKGRINHASQQQGTRSQDRTQQARELENEVVLEWLRTIPGPRVVAGDFNTPPNAFIHRQLAAEATDAFGTAGRGWGFTYRSDRPLIRIDYVWCAGGIVPVTAQTLDGEVSDHRLVVTDLLLPEAGSPSSRSLGKPFRAGRPGNLPPAGPEDTR